MEGEIFTILSMDLTIKYNESCDCDTAAPLVAVANRFHPKYEGEFQMAFPLLPWLKAKVADLKKEQGQTFVEYVMIIVIVALAVYIANPNITSAVLGVFSSTSSALANAP
jgi:Flp pilus assembly pilin Flp